MEVRKGTGYFPLRQWRNEIPFQNDISRNPNPKRGSYDFAYRIPEFDVRVFERPKSPLGPYPYDPCWQAVRRDAASQGGGVTMGNILAFPVERTASPFRSLTPKQRSFVEECAPEDREKAARMVVAIDTVFDRAKAAANPGAESNAMLDAVTELERLLTAAKAEQAITERDYVEHLAIVHAWAEAVEKERIQRNACQPAADRGHGDAEARMPEPEKGKSAFNSDCQPGTPDEAIQDWMEAKLVELLTPEMGAAQAKWVVRMDNPKRKPKPKA